MGEETEFADDSHYEEKAQSDHHWQEAWDHFEHSLKTQTRFFNSDAAQLLASVFDGIEALNTRNGDLPVVDAGPGTAFAALHRARVFQDSNELETALARPDLNLGFPPSRLASAGRMNARGVSVFYGATSPDVALAGEYLRAMKAGDVPEALIEKGQHHLEHHLRVDVIRAPSEIGLLAAATPFFPPLLLAARLSRGQCIPRWPIRRLPYGRAFLPSRQIRKLPG